MGTLFPSSTDSITVVGKTPSKKSFSTFFKSRNWGESITLFMNLNSIGEHKRKKQNSRSNDVARQKELLECLELENIEHLGNRIKEAESFFKDEIGQFNYFFRVNVDREPLLHNLPIAAATFCQSSKYFDEYQIEDDDSQQSYFTSYNLHNCDLNKNNTLHFVCLLDVYSTRVGTLFFNQNDDCVDKRSIFEQWNQVGAFLTIDLEPERKSVMIYGDLNIPINRKMFTSTDLDID
jgi:hypothetical protein